MVMSTVRCHACQWKLPEGNPGILDHPHGHAWMHNTENTICVEIRGLRYCCVTSHCTSSLAAYEYTQAKKHA